MRNSFTATVGVFTPLHGCNTITKSLSAVVKTADKMIFCCRMVAAGHARSVQVVTHSRTWVGRMSHIFIVPNHGTMCRSRP